MRSRTAFTAVSILLLFATVAHAGETLATKVAAGRKTKIYWSGRIDPTTCKVEDVVNYRPDIVREPAHGTLSTGHEQQPFQSSAGAHPCNGKPFLANILYYQSAKGFKGEDEFVIRNTALAHYREMTTELTVKVKVE